MMFSKYYCLLTLLSFSSLVCAKIIDVADPASFERETKTGLVVVKFSAPWCQPCRNMRPVFERWSDDSVYKNIKFVEADINSKPMQALVDRFGFGGIPAFICFDNGQQVGAVIIGSQQDPIKSALTNLAKRKK